MQEKENRRVRMTKKLLKDALIELMQKDRISKISIKKICEQADVNRTTFYLHYTDQYALLDDIINEIYQYTKTYLSEVDNTLGSIGRTKAFFAYIKANREVFYTLLVMEESPAFEHKLLELLLESIVRYLPMECDSTMSKYGKIYIAQGHIQICKEWIKSDFDLSEDEIARLSYNLSECICKSGALFTESETEHWK